MLNAPPAASEAAPRVLALPGVAGAAAAAAAAAADGASRCDMRWAVDLPSAWRSPTAALTCGWRPPSSRRETSPKAVQSMTSTPVDAWACRGGRGWGGSWAVGAQHRSVRCAAAAGAVTVSAAHLLGPAKFQPRTLANSDASWKRMVDFPQPPRRLANATLRAGIVAAAAGGGAAGGAGSCAGLTMDFPAACRGDRDCTGSKLGAGGLARNSSQQGVALEADRKAGSTHPDDAAAETGRWRPTKPATPSCTPRPNTFLMLWSLRCCGAR